MICFVLPNVQVVVMELDTPTSDVLLIHRRYEGKSKWIENQSTDW